MQDGSWRNPELAETIYASDASDNIEAVAVTDHDANMEPHEPTTARAARSEMMNKRKRKRAATTH
jgi:hypothetical protein